MNTIDPVGYERQPNFRQAPPAAAPHDRDSDHGSSRDKDHDGHHGDNVPDAGATPARNAASPQHTLNLTA